MVNAVEGSFYKKTKKKKLGLNGVADPFEDAVEMLVFQRLHFKVVLHKPDKLWQQRNSVLSWKQSPVSTVLSCVLVKQEIHVEYSNTPGV